MSVSRISQNKSIMGMRNQRMFASNLPNHIKIEMPNLSPTMEKVINHIYYSFDLYT